MPCQSGRHAHADRKPREDGAIAGTSGDHHVGALVERAQERLLAHHSDDALGAVDHAFIEFRRGLERLDAALAEAVLEIRLVLFGMDQRQAETQSLLARNFQHDVAHERQMRLAAGGPRGSNQQRHPGLPRGLDHEPQIALNGTARKRRRAGAERRRAGIGRAGIAADEMRPARHAGRESSFP